MKQDIDQFRHCWARGKKMMKRILQKRIVRNQEGFTLLEVIIAISILTAGLLAVGAMQVSAIYGNSLAGKMTAGTSIAEDKLEELLSLEYTLTATHPDLSEGAHAGGAVSGYNLSWTVTNNSPIDNTKEITVTITWQDQWMNKSTSLSAYLARS